MNLSFEAPKCPLVIRAMAASPAFSMSVLYSNVPGMLYMTNDLEEALYTTIDVPAVQKSGQSNGWIRVWQQPPHSNFTSTVPWLQCATVYSTVICAELSNEAILKYFTVNFIVL